MNTRYVIVSIAILALIAFSTPASADESCWDDTFSDETGIEVKYNLTVADGNVTLAGGTDHNAESWTPANGAEISGVHHNIGTFTVAAGTTVYVAPYDNETGLGGSLEIHANTINIQGDLNGAERGYPGGNGSGHYYYGGPGGDAWYPERGTGDGGTHNEVDGAGQYPPTGEDYKLSSGGGGGYGGEGGLGCSYWTGYTGVGDAPGGDAYGTSNTYLLKIGASGAGGGGGCPEPGCDNPPCCLWGGNGGAGGAGILLDAATVTIEGTINVNADDGGDGETGYKGCGGGGGGAGGSIEINAGTLSGSGSLYAEGGDGGDAGDGLEEGGHAAGGAGGGAGGRIKVWYESSTFSGSHSVMYGSGGACGMGYYGNGIDGFPGEEGTYYSTSQTYSPCTPGGSNYKPSGYLKSIAITPSSIESWSTFSANHTENVETNISYQILNATDDSTLCTITAGEAAAGYDISSCADATDSIRLYADLNTTNASNTPVLHDWTVCWIAESPTPATPFQIYGWVNDTEGALLNDPDVNVTNLNTSEIYDVETNASFHYYQVITCSGNVSAGDVLHFTAIAETTKEFNYTVEVDDMNRGGFEQNITIEATSYPDLVITAINAYHYSTSSDAWFNLTNEIDVTVENIGDVNATETFNVSLSIEGVPFGKLSVSQLNISESKTVTFEGWTPVGEDCLKPVCQFDWSSEDYNFTAVADCDNDVEERYEGNNETTVVDMACYNGYMADEPLENVAHGVLHGGMLFTTGDGQYESLSPVGSYSDTHYNIELPAGASVELAHLNVYYTWNKPLGTCPEMEVNITIPNGTTYTALPLMEAYNDIKCECEGSQWVLPWGNYVYDLTNYITENGTYTVRVKNNCTACDSFCPAAPGIVLVYEDANASQIEYWINEGADKLIGGRRADGGSLAWWECINNATFQASGETGNVVNATLGVVSPWGESAPDNILFFNGVEVGRGVYRGHSTSLYDETIDSISMYVGESGNTQVGANLTDVSALYLQGSDNMAGQADDGDCMMPANAFLVVEYGEEVETYTVDGYIFKSDGNPQPDPEVNITNLANGKEWAASINDNFYTLTLNDGVDVNESETLLIVACKDISTYESNCNVTNITATIPGGDHNVNLTLNHYCLNYYPSYPFHTWGEVNWSGPAAMEMMIDHYRDPPHVPNQTELNETGIGYNQVPCNANLSFVDPRGMKYTLNKYLHSYNGLPYVANYGIGSYDAIEDVLHYMCKWHYLGPGAAPAYGNYSNWMAVRGIHTDVKPTFTQGSYSIYGFWINDPNPGGIGENTYKTVDQWSSTYHLNLTDVRDCDGYEGKYVAVCEPPEPDDVTVSLVPSPARFNDEATQVVQAARDLQVQPQQSVTGTDVDDMGAEMTFGAEVGDVVAEANRWIVQAAIDGAMEQLVPYDAGFAAVFADVVGTEPMLVKSDATGDYYLVPFASSDESTSDILVVVIIDAENGHFKEASWVGEPVKYLPISAKEIRELVDKAGTSAELVYRGSSPYYPDWKVTVGESVFFVSQDGTLSYDSDDAALLKEALKGTLEKNVEVYGGIYDEFEIDAARDVAEVAEYGLDSKFYNQPEAFVELIIKSTYAEEYMSKGFVERGIINDEEAKELANVVVQLRERAESVLSGKLVTLFDAVEVANAQDDVTEVIQTLSGKMATLKATLEKNVEVYSGIYKESDVWAAREVAAIAEQGLAEGVYDHPKDFMCLIDESIDVEHKVCNELWDRGIINETEAEELHEQLEAIRYLIKDTPEEEAAVVANAQDEVTDAISQQFSQCTETMIATMKKNVEVYGKIHDKLREDFKYESEAAKEFAGIAQEWLDNMDYYRGKKYGRYEAFMGVIHESIDMEHEVCDNLKELNLIKWAESKELHEQLEFIPIYMEEMCPSVPDIAHLQDEVTETMQTVIESPMVIDYGSGLGDWCESQSEPPYWCFYEGWVVDGDTVEPGYERGHPANAIVRDGEGQGWENRANCTVADSDDYADITLDMGETKNSGTITLRCAIDIEVGHFDGTTTVYGSVDKNSWNELGTFVIPEDGTLTDYTVAFSDEQVRYVKAYLSIGEAGATWFVDAITW